MARTSSPLAAHAAEPRVERRATLPLIVASLRPEQWSKNLLLFAALLFGGRLLEPDAVFRAGAGFVIFCALSGAMYLLNDVWDREADARHPLKQHRPVASGALPSGVAVATGSALMATGIVGAMFLSPRFAAAAVAYAVLLLLYSAFLKHIVIIDVLTIAGGFVLRAVAGAVAVSVPIGSWLVACTLLLALFLALSKRRHELVLLGDGAVDHRRILNEYSPYLLDQMIAVVTASTVIAYAVFATNPDTAQRLGTRHLGLTIPFVLYGIFRYLYLVHQKRGGGSPAAMLATDRPLLACVALWVAAVAALMYSPVGRW
jgi:4-hydroxybenzoate polyprenyltransferase